MLTVALKGVTVAGVNMAQMCYSQYECSPGQYCDHNYACYDCSYVTPGSCDSLNNDCCDAAFLSQCPNDPYGCAGGGGDSSDPSAGGAKKKCKGDDCDDLDVELMLIVACACATAYVALGTLYGVQAQGKRGLTALPNYHFWAELGGLVKDGVSFVTGNNAKGRQYAPVPDVEAAVVSTTVAAAATQPRAPLRSESANSGGQVKKKKRPTSGMVASPAADKKKKKKKRVPDSSGEASSME